MTLESRRIVFFQLPLRHPASRANPEKKLVSKPSRSPAALRVVYYELFIAVRSNPGPVSQLLNRANPMQNSFSRGPQLDLLNQAKKVNPLAIVSLRRRFVLLFRIHCNLSYNVVCRHPSP